jgi:GT2 family glycosyltransferase
MTSEVAVSVVMSTRNRARYLPDSLRCLARQDCEARFEVIVIDNASTDDTAAVVDAWCRSDPRFRTAYEPRLGLSCGKNAGVKLARAPLLLFTDDDILTDRAWIQSFLDLFARRDNGLSLAGGPCVPVPHDLGAWPDWFSDAALGDVALLDHGEERLLTGFEYVWGGNMAVPRHLFDRFGGWDETVGRKGDDRGTFEDTEFQDRVRQAGGQVWFCPPAIGRHRMPRSSITPRQVTSTAFTRGRNSFWMKTIPIWRDASLVPKRNALTALSSLTGSLLQWAVGLVAFRFTASRRAFERGRQGAFASGCHLESLRAGRALTRFSTAANRITFKVRALLLRMCPDGA